MRRPSEFPRPGLTGRRDDLCGSRSRSGSGGVNHPRALGERPALWEDQEGTGSMTEDEHPEITSEDFTLPAAKPRADFYWTVQREVMNAARQQGTEIRERKIWKDSSLTTRYAEPAAGIALARPMKHTADRVEYDYIRYAPPGGRSWAAIGAAPHGAAHSPYPPGPQAVADAR